MGKRRRRLHSPKFAKKFASVRTAIARLSGAIKEVKFIEPPPPEVIELVVEVEQALPAPEMITETAKEHTEVAVEEKVKAKLKKKPAKRKASTRKRATKKKEDNS